MAIVLFDQPHIRKNLLPFTYTRPVSEIRVGIFTITEKWQKHLNTEVGWLTEEYLQSKFPFPPDASLFINGGICPDKMLLEAIGDLPGHSALVKGDLLIAFRGAPGSFYTNPEKYKNAITFQGELMVIDRPWKIFMLNGRQIIADFDLLKERSSEKITDPHTSLYGEENIFVEEGVRLKAAIINAENGPVYLGRNSEIAEGAMVRGPFALGEGAALNMGTRIRGDATIGPFCKVGGEISNSVFFGYSSKAHDGFFGNSVVGEWCNIGADTNTSNLKNNYKPVKLWSYTSENTEDTGLQFCGLMMGDHTKCSINTMFNTGTVVGVGANIFGEGFPPTFVPSFSWGGSKKLETFSFDKFLEMTEVVMLRRNKKLEKQDINILEAIFNASKKFRTWEK